MQTKGAACRVARFWHSQQPDLKDNARIPLRQNRPNRTSIPEFWQKRQSA